MSEVVVHRVVGGVLIRVRLDHLADHHLGERLPRLQGLTTNHLAVRIPAAAGPCRRRNRLTFVPNARPHPGTHAHLDGPAGCAPADGGGDVPGPYSEPDPARTIQEDSVDSPALITARNGADI
ncbi:hypothetical protein GCM10009831_09360 [Dietzia cercidiphylli]|uniref:Uncharacterized protein n=1 Tax=Dietzia cercidiphylli TaxID=498199 RepID=A0ABN2ICV0_9ACTN